MPGVTYAPRGPADASDRQQRRPGGRLQPEIMSLQRHAGNAAVTALLRSPRAGGDLMDPAAAGGAAPTHTRLPEWSREELRAIQGELRRLGLYALSLDGRYGPGTASGLVEAFGGNEWRYLPVDEITSRVRAAKPSHAGHRGEHQLRYGEMFRDGVLDITVAFGFDEENSSQAQVQAIRAALAERSFKLDPADGALLMHLGGHDVGKNAIGDFLVRRDALTYRPPAGDPRQVHVVVRLIDGSAGKSGAADAAAFEDGIAQSDVTTYAGHGRYGTGPDFDRNFTSLSMVEDDGSTTTFEDYEKMETALRVQGRRHGRSVWEQFLWLNQHHRVSVTAAHQGNVYINPEDLHSNEFGARLLYWTLKRDGRPLQTGRDGGLAARTGAAKGEHPYRVVLFDGCRTQDYVKSIRGTADLDTASTDVFATRKVTYWSDKAQGLVTFLDELIAQQSAETIVRGLDAQQGVMAPSERGGTWGAFGVTDNPVNR
jgi:hypothetical protein